MTTTRKIPARFLSATAALTSIALLTVGCGSSTPKAEAPAETTTTATTATPAATDAVDSDFCQTARKWMVHEFNGDGESFADDPVALKKYWNDYIEFDTTARAQAPADISDDWPVGYDFIVTKFTPVLEKYNYDIARAKAEGTPAELAIGKRIDEGPNAEEQAAQDAVQEYEDRVCQTGQPPAADVSFAGATKNQNYCDAVQSADALVGEKVGATQWSVDGVRSFITSAEFKALAAKAKANAPAEIKADVIADTDWQLNEQADVIAKFGYDARKLFLEGTAADRAIFQRSDPAIADHYARTIAYEEQVCGFD